MLSILGRLLCRELGVHKYNSYFEQYVESEPDENKREIIFYDIYKELDGKDIYALQQMLERLLGAVELSLKINRQFVWVVIGTLLTVAGLFVLPISTGVTLVAVLFVLICFLYKGVVYILNRYSYVDANLMLLYKTALYHKIMVINIRRLARKSEE